MGTSRSAAAARSPRVASAHLSTGTVIVGAGQAGLALSACLRELGQPHLLLERGRVGERWRSERWDSFRLLSPAWHTRLPGHRTPGSDPDAFLDRVAVVTMFEAYARAIDAPVLEGTAVHRVAPRPGGWRVDATGLTIDAEQVVIATGPHDRPRVPELAAAVPPGIAQLHAAHYRRPAQLEPGAVLVVGAGPTGQQLASELARDGRRVVLAVGRHQRLSRSYRGRDAFWWLDRTGLADRTIDEVRVGPDGRPRAVHPVLTAGRDLGLDTLVDEGVLPVGRLCAIDGSLLRFADDLPQRYLDAEAAAARFADTVDAHVARTGLDVPPAPPRRPTVLPRWAMTTPRHLHLHHLDVRTVLWATGYTRDHSFVHAPVFDADGEPLHRRGVTAAPGLYFLGLTWLYRRKSASIDGVGDDAAYLAEVIASTAARRGGRPLADVGMAGSRPR